MPVQLDEGGRQTDRAATEIRLLGPMAVVRDGRPVDLPPSRKARALLAYLLMTPHAVARSALCQLLWDETDDPRAELRWCLSRIRAVLGDSRRLIAHEDAVRLDVAGFRIDVASVDEALHGARPAELDVDRCRALAAVFNGDFLQGLEIDGSPHFGAWLTAQRHRFRDSHAELLERLAGAAAGDEALQYLEQWRRLAPYDQKVHRMLLNELARRGRVREAEEHLQAAVKLFEDEGLDCAPLHSAWLAARSTTAPSTEPETRPVTEAGGRREPVGPDAARRASIAVMPFDEQPAASLPGGAGDAFAHDVITRLAKLRALFVIASGSVFELKARGLAATDAARMLDVDYVVRGSLRRSGGDLRVDVELIDARAGRVAWTDTLAQRQADALAVLDELGNRLVSSIASEVEALERNRAVLKPPSSLDAWESYHRGLWHMYRFDKADNDLARHFFEAAVQLDPTFSRAYAGLSFTHFQGAFQGWAERHGAVDLAFAAAGQSLLADERDPAAHWAMGRALWLRSRHDQCIAELEQAVDLSPNFALGHYTLAFVQSQAGDPHAAIRASDVSRSLSPFDPLLFGMLGARAMALVRLGKYDEAAVAGMQAAARPNAHVHIQAIAAFSLALAGSMEEAESYAAGIRRANPAYTVADFFRAFRFDGQGIAEFRKAAKRLGMG
jgi:DNA-binding SARP family transcriptional activator